MDYAIETLKNEITLLERFLADTKSIEHQIVADHFARTIKTTNNNIESVKRAIAMLTE